MNWRSPTKNLDADHHKGGQVELKKEQAQNGNKWQWKEIGRPTSSIEFNYRPQKQLIWWIDLGRIRNGRPLFSGVFSSTHPPHPYSFSVPHNTWVKLLFNLPICPKSGRPLWMFSNDVLCNSKDVAEAKFRPLSSAIFWMRNETSSLMHTALCRFTLHSKYSQRQSNFKFQLRT